MRVRRLLILSIMGMHAGFLCAETLPADTTEPPPPVSLTPTEPTSPAFGIGGTAGDLSYHSFNLARRTPFNAAIRSALVPGWGQGFNRQKIKGGVFFAATMSALVGSLYMRHSADEAYDKYKARGEKNSSHYDDYESDRTAALALGGAAAILWSVAVIDAYRQAYSPLYSKDASVELALFEENVGVVFKKNF